MWTPVETRVQKCAGISSVFRIDELIGLGHMTHYLPVLPPPSWDPFVTPMGLWCHGGAGLGSMAMCDVLCGRYITPFSR